MSTVSPPGRTPEEMAMKAGKTLATVAGQFGANLLPDNDLWQYRLEIRSQTSSRLYVVAQRKSDLTWGCSCFGYKRWRHCKHLTAMVPLLQAPENRERLA